MKKAKNKLLLKKLPAKKVKVTYRNISGWRVPLYDLGYNLDVAKLLKEIRG